VGDEGAVSGKPRGRPERRATAAASAGRYLADGEAKFSKAVYELPDDDQFLVHAVYDYFNADAHIGSPESRRRRAPVGTGATQHG
jgi:hypothetical protein